MRCGSTSTPPELPGWRSRRIHGSGTGRRGHQGGGRLPEHTQAAGVGAGQTTPVAVGFIAANGPLAHVTTDTATGQELHDRIDALDCLSSPPPDLRGAP